MTGPHDAAASGSAEDLDVVLLALSREFDSTISAVVRLEDERDALPGEDPRVDALDGQVKALVSRRWELREAITDTPARTREGLVAKARVALWELSDGDLEEGPTDGNSSVAWSLAQDVLGRAA